MIKRRISGLCLRPSSVGNGCQGTGGVKRTGRLTVHRIVLRASNVTAGAAVSVTGWSPLLGELPPPGRVNGAIPARTFPLRYFSKEEECVCARAVATERPGTNLPRGRGFGVWPFFVLLCTAEPQQFRPRRVGNGWPGAKLARAVAENPQSCL